MKNSKPLFSYVTVDARNGISVPSHRIVRSEGFQKNLKIAKRIAEKQKELKRLQSEKLIQRFSGFVIEISDDEFAIRFKDMTTKTNPEEIMTFDRNRLPEPKRSELLLGECVYWDIYQLSNGDTRDQFKFLDFGRWTQEEIDQAKIKGKELAELINNGENNNADT